MKRAILIFIVLLSVRSIFGQPPAGAQDRGPMPMDGKVTGKVLDENNYPVEYASVALFSMRDSSLVTGMVTDTAGNFVLTGLQYGRFYAEIKYIGYNKAVVKGIRITPDQKTFSAGVIRLSGSATALNEVVVTGTRPPIEYKIDKKIVNVGQQIAVAGGTAVDVLENTPSVQTDVEGNVTLRGSSNFTVLIDGKPSVLKGSEALQQIPASSIQQIEIITNPSAKYDPDGSAGIINVIMKRQKLVGISGLLNISAGTGDKYSGDILLNIRSSKFNYFVGGDFNDFQFRMKGLFDQRTSYLDTLNFQSSTTDGKFHRSGKRVKAGFDFYINDKNTLSLNANLSDRSFKRFSNANYYEYTSPVTTDQYYIRTNNAVSPRKSIDASLDYLLKFKKDGHQLAATVYYSYEPEKNTTDMDQQSTDSNWNPDGLPSFSQQSTESGTEKEFRAKLDYSLPLSEKGKLEAGYQSRIEGVTGEFHFYNLNNGAWIEDPLQFNEIKFTDHVESVYATFSNSMRLFEYQLGLRAEYTDRNLVKQLTGEEYPINRLDFFPTVHLSKQLPWKMQVLASYSRRINRPGDRVLDPFVTYIDPRNIRQGNPALKPEFADSYELNLQKRIGEGFVSIEGYYKQTYNLISPVYTLKDTLTVQSFANFNRDYSLGTEAMINMPLTKWWTLNATTTAFKYHIDATSTDSARSTITWNSRLNSTFRLKWGTQIQANFFYNAPSITPQGKREGFYFTTIGIRQDLFKKKASITLQARDIFGNMKFTNTTETPELYRFNSFKRESPIFMLTLSYRINNFKQQMKRNNENGNETDYSGEGME